MSKQNLPTILRIREAFNYNPKTGSLTWRIKPSNRVFIGREVGSPDGQGYRILMLDKYLLRTHRVAFAHYYGYWPTGFIDHIDQNRNNNAIKNLRDVSNAVNLQNQTKAQKNSSTKVRGVWFDKRRNKYIAETSCFKKKIYLGSFLTLKEAESAYKGWKSESDYRH